MIDGSVVLQGVLASAAIIPLDAEIVAVARSVQPVHVGALDAIHIASALSLDTRLAGVATYDKRMQGALDREGIRVIAPTSATNDQSLAQTPSSTSDDTMPLRRDRERSTTTRPDAVIDLRRHYASRLTPLAHRLQSSPPGLPRHRLHEILKETVSVPVPYPAPHFLGPLGRGWNPRLALRRPTRSRF